MSSHTSISKKISRRKYLLAAGSTATMALAGCAGGGDGGDGGDGSDGGGGGDGGDGGSTGDGGGSSRDYHFGVSSVFDSAGGIMMFKAGEWWADMQDNVTIDVERASGDLTQQINQLNTMLNQDYDAIFIESLSPPATAEVANDADIPVFGYDVPTYSEEIQLLTSIDNFEYGERAGSRLVSVMEEQNPDVSTYQVVELLMDQDNTNAVQRHQGMNAAWDDAGNVEVTKQIEVDGYSAVDFQEQMNSYLQTDPEFHGICSPLVAGVQGALNALDNFDLMLPKDDPDHVSFTTCDAGPPAPDWIGDGYLDEAAYQPCQYYLPITFHYAVEWFENGQDDSVFPETGTQLTSDELPVMQDEEVDGVKLWETQSWSPADVLEFETVEGENLGYPWIKTNIPVMDESNYDDPRIYPNLFEQLGL